MSTSWNSVLVISIVSITIVHQAAAFEFYRCKGVQACEIPTQKVEGLWYLTWASRAGENNRKSFFKNNNCGVFKNCNDCACLATYFASGDENRYIGYSISSNTKEKKTYVKSFIDEQVKDEDLVFHKCIVNDEAILPYTDDGYENTTYETTVVGDFYKYVLLDTDNNESWRILLVCEDTTDICKSAQPLVLVYTKSKNPGKMSTMKAVLDALGERGLNAHELELTFYNNNGCLFPDWNDFDRCNWGCSCMKPPKQ